MQGFPGGAPDPQQLQATMLALEQAWSLIQVHMNPSEAEKVISSLHSSLMPYQTCRFILETSHVPNARFQAAGAIGDAAIREWGILSDDNKKSLIVYCLNYVMEHASSPEGYVQAKVSAMAARLLKRGWVEFLDQEKSAIFFEVEQSIRGIHGPNRQFAAINFLEALVSEFSPGTASAMGLPREFHEQCQWSLEVKFLKDFYCWAQAAVFNTAGSILNENGSIDEAKACSAAFCLMFHILSWNFKHNVEHADSEAKINSGLRSDAINLKKFERSLVKPGSMWSDILISSEHTTWVLNFYTTARQKYSYDPLWSDSSIATSCRQLIVQLCSLAGSVFPNDNGDAHIKHLMHILCAAVLWIEPPDVIASSIRNGASESEFLDGCHALLSIASLTTSSLFDNLLKSIRHYGTINLLSALTSEAVKSFLDNQNEETWVSDALDISLEIWNVILGDFDADKSPMSVDGAIAASNLFKIIVESHLKAAADSAFEDTDHAKYFHVSVSKRDEQLALYAQIARSAADTTIPFLAQLFSERFACLSQTNGENDLTQTLEELYWLLLITSHVLTDSGEGETLLIPEALQAGFPNVVEVAQHPVVTLSWSIMNFSRRCLDPGIRARYFSPRLMEAVVWFLARWIATYLVPLDVSRGHVSRAEFDNADNHGLQHSRKVLNSFAWENNQGELVLDFVVLISMVALTTYQGENELQTLTCQKLLATVVRRKHTCTFIVQLDSWHDLTRAFARGRSLFSLSGRLQRSLAETLACAASCIKDPEASAQYLRDLMGPVAGCLVENASRSDFKSVAQQADVIFMVCCLLERLRGAARATQPHTQKVLFEMGHTVMNSLLTLLEVYKNQSAIINMILRFVVDFVDGQAVFLDANEKSVLVNFCLQLLQIYSSHNIWKVMLSLSSSLRSESQAEKYKDLCALLRLLTNICSKDLVGFLSDSSIEGSQDIGEVIYVGLDIVTPLISLDLLKYPKLSRDYFALVSHLLEVYPEKVANLNKDAFARIIGTRFILSMLQDSDIVERCLTAINALASYHFKERLGGRGGLNSQLMESEGSNGKLQESISSHFLRLMLQLLLFNDFRMELAGSAADAFLPLLLCEHELYQRLVQEFVEKQQNPTVKSRLAMAFHNLTNSNNLSSSLDRPNRRRFRKNLRTFLRDVAGFMQIE
ncbi:hypothetical protein ABZP36_011639 [Zizania latifolia]